MTDDNKKTMKAARWFQNGAAPEVLKVVDVPVPEPAEGEVLVRVVAASVNPIDYKLIQGDFGKKGEAPKHGFGVGSDFSGKIEAVGAGVEAFKVGDEIMGNGLGSFPLAEYVALPAYKVVAKPANISFEEASGLLLAAQTAYEALVQKAGGVAGKKVLILGGSGGVGSFGIQIAKALEAETVVTTSSNVKHCTDLGADEVVNYKEQDVGKALAGRGFDIIFDCVGGYDQFCIGSAAGKAGAKFVTIVGDGGGIPAMLPGILYRKVVSSSLFAALGSTAVQYSIFMNDNGDSEVAQSKRDGLRKLVEESKLKVAIDRSGEKEGGFYSLDTVDKFFAKLMTHRTKGKLVLKF